MSKELDALRAENEELKAALIKAQEAAQAANLRVSILRSQQHGFLDQITELQATLFTNSPPP